MSDDEILDAAISAAKEWLEPPHDEVNIRHAVGAALDVALSVQARPADEWHEEIGDVLWWKFPITEPPYIGSPNDLGHTVEVTVGWLGGTEKMPMMVGGWPGYHTHWTPIPLPSPPEESK